MYALIICPTSQQPVHRQKNHQSPSLIDNSAHNVSLSLPAKPLTLYNSNILSIHLLYPNRFATWGTVLTGGTVLEERIPEGTVLAGGTVLEEEKF